MSFAEYMRSTNITYRIIAFTMAFLMFFTSVGFNVDMHYCQGELKHFNFFGKAKSCHEVEEGMKDCPHHKKMMEEKSSSTQAISKKDCCQNKILHFQSNQTQLNHTVTMSPQLQSFLFAFVGTFLNFSVIKTEKLAYAHYKPPLVPKDIYVLLETFLL